MKNLTCTILRDETGKPSETTLKSCRRYGVQQRYVLLYWIFTEFVVGCNRYMCPTAVVEWCPYTVAPPIFLSRNRRFCSRPYLLEYCAPCHPDVIVR